MSVSDHNRREARATFHRAVAYIQNVTESWNKTMPNGPEEPAALSTELVTTLAILATIGPPRADGEEALLDTLTDEEMAEAEIVPADQLPTLLRDSRVTAIVGEIVGTVTQFDQEHPAYQGYYKRDREILACQVAVNLTYEKYGEDTECLQQQSWEMVAHYLRNHDDGYWLLVQTGGSGDDDDEEEGS